MQNRRNYYRLLQVQPDAPIEVIRASYRTLMRELKHHPDLGGSSSNAALLNEAYRTLSHPALRAEYDKKLFLRYTKQSLSSPALSDPDRQRCPICKVLLTHNPARPGQICSVCQSPLRSKEGTGESDRRALARIKRDGRVHYWMQWPQKPQEAKMMDISPQGMRLLCGLPIQPGTALKISGPGFEASAIVKDLSSEKVGREKLHAVGVSFVAVTFENPRGSFLSTLV